MLADMFPVLVAVLLLLINRFPPLLSNMLEVPCEKRGAAVCCPGGGSLPVSGQKNTDSAWRLYPSLLDYGFRSF